MTGRRLVRSGQLCVEVVPVRVADHDRAGLVGAQPALHRGLALDRALDLVMPFVPDKALQPVTAREARQQPLAVFIGPASEVVGHADIERAVRPVRHDVDPAALPHAGRMSGGEVRDKRFS